MNNQTASGIIVPISEIYPDTTSDFETFRQLLQNLSLTDTLFWCARLNHAILNPSGNHVEKQQACLNALLTNREVNRINTFVQNFGDINRVAIFFRGQLLELARWALLFSHDFPNDGETFEDPEIREKFTQAALIAGDIWVQRVFGDRFSVDDGIEEGRKRALGAARKSIEGGSENAELNRHLSRGWTLFNDYLPNFYSNFHSEFEALTGLPLDHYYIMYALHFSTILNAEQKIFDANDFQGPPGTDEVFERFMSCEAQNVENLKSALWGDSDPTSFNDSSEAPPYDYRPLRQKPILRTNDGRAIILDVKIFSEAIAVGPLFTLANDKSREQSLQLFGAFGEAIEAYSCEILRRMFPSSSNLLADRLVCNLQGRDAQGKDIEIDACINDVSEVIFFEIKAVWLRDDSILQEDTDRFIAHLRERYGVTQGQSKGVGQLARFVTLLANREWQGAENEFGNAQIVYPVMVVHDSLLDAPLFCNFLFNEFRDALEPDTELDDGYLVKGNIKIAPLIVMTLNDLENMETSTEHFRLMDLLRDYSIACPERLQSLKEFIYYSDYNQKIYSSRYIGEKGVELMDKAHEFMGIPIDSDTAEV